MVNGFELTDISNVKSRENLTQIIQKLRIVAANKSVSTSSLTSFIEEAIKKSVSLDDHISRIRLYDLQIRQLYNYTNNIAKIAELLDEMEGLSKSNDFSEGQALVYQIKWHFEKLKGNKKQSRSAILSAMNLIEQQDIRDQYTIYGCKYAYAVEIWLNKHSMESAILLEKCVVFFYKDGFYRSLAQSFGLLGIIYTQLNESLKALDLSNQILANRPLFENLPTDVKGIVYYFAGWANILNANLKMAESYFNEANSIFKPIYKDSIYFSNYLILQSYYATAQALQGKIVQSSSIIKEAYLLLQLDYFKKKLDKTTAKQVNHNLNLVKFYNISRLSKFIPKEHQELINKILENSRELLSDFMTLSEFILNSNLDSNTLQGLLSLDNFSVNRVKHIIKYMIKQQNFETEIDEKQKILKCIDILKNREITAKTTFMEHTYADLLIAQQLFSLKRYAEISPLLKKYEMRLNQIEVLEMRIFMEAFIQVGAFKNGDPLGPALQYMAIKKCRDYGFSKLENKLVDYLQLQHKEIKRAI